jgi:threonylcarbamoyladenosine tRNA methylthiotransferase MtaB
MVEELPFTYLHVFTYSARPGTPAAERPDQIPVTVARERNRILREIASRKKAAFMRSLVGTRVEAVTLRASSSSTSGSKTSGSSTSGSDASGDGVDFTEALTENYLKIKIRGRHAANRWMDVYVEVADGEMLVGAPLGVGEAPL